MQKSFTEPKNPTSLTIISDEETQMALECAMRIKTHLERAYVNTQSQRFADRLQVLDEFISNSRENNCIEYPSLSTLGLAS